ncbi:hypothetical protein [Bradyrhizobium sp. BR13661]|jgi:hypothetical protein|nr:hypothetical protein [Bradyrhizobium sp. BR13661]MDH6257028.1 ElaB/YqjD/DUF883 family membrane-anchored ribosome-binding protein [Bradyrhizobium sp. BR13661]
MKLDNIVQFPSPDPNRSAEDAAAEITNLSDELASVLSKDESGGLGEQLSRVEKATFLLDRISQLVSRGSDRLRANETAKRIAHSIAELRRDYVNRLEQKPASNDQPGEAG